MLAAGAAAPIFLFNKRAHSLTRDKKHLRTMNVFWQTIAGYNAATWPLQALLVVAGIVLTALLYRRPSPRVKVAMKFISPCSTAGSPWPITSGPAPSALTAG